MATFKVSHNVNKATLSGFDVKYVEQWQRERKPRAIVSDREPRAYMLLHKTDFDGLKRAPFRYVVDFIYVPEDKRRQGIAHEMLTAPMTFKLNLVAFVNSDHSEALFIKAGFLKENDQGMMSRDDARIYVDKPLTIHGLQSRPELNGEIVTPSRFCTQDARYECRTDDGDWIRVKSTNMKNPNSLHELWRLAKTDVHPSNYQPLQPLPAPSDIGDFAMVAHAEEKLSNDKWPPSMQWNFEHSHLGVYLRTFVKASWHFNNVQH